MMETSQHVALAQELDQAERTRVQVEQFSRRHPAMTIADSYAIQYEDSEKLLYGNDRIHRNYNRWVRNLSEEIKANLGVGG